MADIGILRAAIAPVRRLWRRPAAIAVAPKVGDDEQTEKVSALAKTRLSGVKAGEKVQLTRKDVAGKREVVSIRRAKELARK